MTRAHAAVAAFAALAIGHADAATLAFRQTGWVDRETRAPVEGELTLVLGTTGTPLGAGTWAGSFIPPESFGAGGEFLNPNVHFFGLYWSGDAAFAPISGARPRFWYVFFPDEPQPPPSDGPEPVPAIAGANGPLPGGEWRFGSAAPVQPCGPLPSTCGVLSVLSYDSVFSARSILTGEPLVPIPPPFLVAGPAAISVLGLALAGLLWARRGGVGRAA